MKHPLDWPLLQNQRAIVAIATVLTAGIAVLDWRAVTVLSLGFLYLFPILLVAAFLDRRWLACFCLTCDLLHEAFAPSRWDSDAATRLLTVFLAYFGSGLFVSEIARNRRTALLRNAELALQIQSRKAAEARLDSMVEGSPAATVVVNPEGHIVLANEAAHALLRCEPKALLGQPIEEFLPTLSRFREPSSIRHLVRTMIECNGRRWDGRAFLAQVWMSSAGPPAETGFTAVIFDASDALRDREELEYHTLALSARVVMGAFWHETRNLCTAMRMLVQSLKYGPKTRDAQEVEGLDTLVTGLEKLTSTALRPDEPGRYEMASLRAVLDNLRIIVEPWKEESQIRVTWQEADDLPLVRADHHALLQVFMNLANNARRALESVEPKELGIRATVEDNRVLVRFLNSGSPIEDPAALFAPFQPMVEHGIGLHVSQALMRSFGGDLRYEPTAGGCCFTAVLEPRRISDIYEDARK